MNKKVDELDKKVAGLVEKVDAAQKDLKEIKQTLRNMQVRLARVMLPMPDNVPREQFHR